VILNDGAFSIFSAGGRARRFFACNLQHKKGGGL
jgi:hypothetical protein